MSATTPEKIESLRLRAEAKELRTRLAMANLRGRAVAQASKSVRSASRPRRRDPEPMLAAMGGYDSAIGGLTKPALRGSGGAAFSQLDQPTLDRLRRSCQHAERNDPAARALIKTKQALVVGDGAIVRSTTKNEAWNEQADAMFARWAAGDESAQLGVPDVTGRDLWQVCRLIVKAWDTDGDALVIKLGDAAGERARGCLQLVEGERVRSPDSITGIGRLGSVSGAPQVIMGVEADRFGRPVRYHVAPWAFAGQVVGFKTQTVEASESWLLVNPTDDRLGMVRGEPGLQASLPRLSRLDTWCQRHALMAHIATLFGAWIESPMPAELQAAHEATDANQPTDGPGTMHIEPAGVMYGLPGEKMTQIKPEYPNLQYRDYVTTELMLVAADLGLPVSFAFFDGTSSYIQERAKGAIAMRRFYHVQAVLARFVREVRAWKMAQWIAEHRLGGSDEFDRCEVHFPDAPVFDMGAEVDAWRDGIEANLFTQDQATQALGAGRGSEVMKRRAAEVKAQRDLGIEPPFRSPGAMRPGEVKAEP